MDTLTALPDGALASPASVRNAEPILKLLRAHLPKAGRVLEIAAGSGQHALTFSSALPGLEWTPSDPSPDARASIAAWAAQAGAPNLQTPLALDCMDETTWPEGPFDAVLCINMIHIAPWSATEGLMRGAAAILPPGAPLILYGPYRRDGAHTAPSNAAFDADLRARNPAWGVRDLEAVAALAASHGFGAPEIAAMPANNLTLVFRRG